MKNPLTVAQRTELTRIFYRLIDFINQDELEESECENILADMDCLDDMPQIFPR